MPHRTSSPAAPSSTGFRPTRRSLLMVGAALPLSVAALTARDAALAPAHAQDDFATLGRRWADYLTGGPDLDTDHPQIADQVAALADEAQDLLETADVDPAPEDPIWQDLPMVPDDAANMNLTYQRLLAIATAWGTVGTDQHADPEVLELLLAWYRHMYTHLYTDESTRGSGNWWFWEIGIPRDLGYLSILLDEHLTDEDRAGSTEAIRRQAPDPNVRRDFPTVSEQGGNRADKALACLLRGITARDADDMVLGRDALSDVAGGGAASLFTYVTSGNGFYADGSYIDHDFLPYVGTYGNVALSGVSRSLMLLAGSRWEVTDPDVEVILGSPERSFAPFVYQGRMMDTVRGRAVSREREPSYLNAWSTVNSMLLLATSLGEPHRSTYQSLAKGWLEASTEDYTAWASLSDLSRALPVLADDGVAGAEEPVGHQQFGAQERMVHRAEARGAHWGYTVSTSSTRIGRYEAGNDENNLGWHQGDGAAYLYLASDQSQFDDDYWPTVDPYRLPGTTASLAERESHVGGGWVGIPRAENRWGGGVGLAGTWGTAGMDLTNTLGTVSAKKSWFLLEDMVIAVGSGVDVSGTDAETIVENRGFAVGSSPELTVDGAPVVGLHEGLHASYAHLDGVAGYVLLGEEGPRLRAEVADRSGTWREINSGADTGGSDEQVTRTYATLSLEHPAGTSGSTYAYAILPGASAQATASAAEDLEVEILRQDASAHIIRVRRQGRWFLFAHLFDAVEEGPVQADGPCAVAVSGERNTAQLALSSPTKSLEAAQLSLDLDRPYHTVVSAHDRLQVTGGRRIEIQATLSHAAGASFEAELRVQ